MAIQVIRELAARFSLETDKQSFSDARERLNRFGVAAAKAGAAAAAALAGFAVALAKAVDGTRELAGEVDKLSRATGFSSDFIQELGFAAERNGVGFEQFADVLTEFRVKLGEAATGTGAAADAFKKLGINVRSAQRDPQRAILEFSDRVAALNNRSEQLFILDEALGDVGKELINVFAQGSKGIEEYRRQAQSLGFVIDRDLLEQSDKLTESQIMLRLSLQGVRNTIAREATPAWTRLNKAISDSVSANRGIAGTGLGRFLAFVMDGITSIIDSQFVAKIREIIGPISDWAEALNDVFSGLKSIFSPAVQAGLLALKILAVGVEDAFFGLVELMTGNRIRESLTALFFTDTAKAINLLSNAIERFAVERLEEITTLLFTGGGALLGFLAGGPLGALVGATAGGLASLPVASSLPQNRAERIAANPELFMSQAPRIETSITQNMSFADGQGSGQMMSQIADVTSGAVTRAATATLSPATSEAQ